MTWKHGLAMAIAVVAVLAIPLVPGVEPLLLGWLYFPMRVLPRMTADPPAVLVGLIAFAAFVVGLHWLIRRLMSVSADRPPWKWQTTVTLATLLVLLFVAGTAMVGATHQLMWLLTGRPRPPEQTFGIRDAIVQSSQQAEISNELKWMAGGVQGYDVSYNALPPGGYMNEQGELMHGWAAFVGPFALFTLPELDYSIPWDEPPNDKLYKCNLQMFVNPALPGPYFDSRGFGLAHIAGNKNVLTMHVVKQADLDVADHRNSPMYLSKKPRLTLQTLPADGAANTILIGTVSQRFKPWGHPANLRDPAVGIDQSPDGFGGPPSWKGALFAYADGHTAIVNRKVDPRVLQQLASPANAPSPTSR